MGKKNNDLKEVAYNELKERLIKCKYTPGSILNETQIGEEFGLSRTPVREAISRLEMEGYLKVLPKKGILVTEISLDDVIQIFQARIEIEPVALKMSIPYLDPKELLKFKKYFEVTPGDSEFINSFDMDTQMHLYIINNCRNDYIIDMMHRVYDHNTRVIISSKENEKHFDEARVQHLGILNSILQNDDPEYSASLMRKHILTCKKFALDNFYSVCWSKTESGSVEASH
ncbi:MAG: GntR family transcriptional regulator [Oscillospiraceae bacterium]|jgi:DNA-binding GntR family transcriptional regulator